MGHGGQEGGRFLTGSAPCTQVCEEAKGAWDALGKKLGRPPGDDVRPEGHGHPVAAVAIPGRKPWGRTVLGDRLGSHAPLASVEVGSGELARARAEVAPTL